ncbi:N-acetylmuramoyl-L-alanine amidase [Litoreibacter ponti]|uniref:N-acetylmuramoyl-L-alanine amidase n=1 Tax=Litoreibacter ponti TaxID=1510457 RepID=A0A2T6BDJ5_9RHOB|nr:N-acetylmuramoyl-L-alanine amidase [Litoreibacter ponti]PTX54138.1 N-acetylmuramoyl-L-alanine amidase [Litoreibacter ponti]
MTPEWRPSPNFGDRKDGARPELVVLHYTAMSDCEAACRALSNPETEVSAHYLIREDGHVIQLVEEEKRAWHAGAGSWQGRGDVNSRSIGIEMSNTGFAPFGAGLMDSLETLMGGVLSRWSMPPDAVIAHSDLAPGRKIDPGRRFDWRRLARQGLAVWPEYGDAEPDPVRFHAAAIRFGYSAEVEDDIRLAAFRLRFNPSAEGPVAARDVAMAEALALRWGIDRQPAVS